MGLKEIVCKLKEFFIKIFKDLKKITPSLSIYNIQFNSFISLLGRLIVICMLILCYLMVLLERNKYSGWGLYYPFYEIYYFVYQSNWSYVLFSVYIIIMIMIVLYFLNKYKESLERRVTPLFRKLTDQDILLFCSMILSLVFLILLCIS